MEQSRITDSEYRKMQEAEVAEELALRNALKRVQLEEDAKSPSTSRYQWISHVIFGAGLLYFHDQLADNIWSIVLYLVIEIRTSSVAVHRRINAILELERLRIEAERNKQMKSA